MAPGRISAVLTPPAGGLSSPPMSPKRQRIPLTVVLDFFGVLVQEGMSVSHNLYRMVRSRVAYEPMWTSYMRLAVGESSN